jgi:3-oxoacyl-[acyl-carrier protein] reductase
LVAEHPLAGRAALVTGANHGIGAAAAEALAALGASIAASYLRLDAVEGDPAFPPEYARNRSQDAEAVLERVRGAGVDGISIEADLADPPAARHVFDRAEAALGPVSILINNASGWRKDSFATSELDAFGRRNAFVSLESINSQLLVDARGGALLIAELARRHHERHSDWGRIVSLTSGGPSGFPGEVSYGAAKAALDNYTMSASSELAHLGITANVVHPPVTDTGWVTDPVREAVAASQDMHHVATPAEVAEVIAWLCTDAARLVTGNLIRLR